MTPPADKTPVGIIGVGNMGAGMAANLLAQGWPVQVRDLVSAKEQELERLGAVAHASPAQLAINCEVVIVCVVDAAQTREVLFGFEGAATAMRAGQAVMLCPTIAPQDVEAFAGELAARSIHTIDAPMSGGPVRARDGSMSLMLACPDAVFEQHRALLQALSNKLFRIGQRPGDGARTKLVNNLLAGINLVGAAEVLALAGRMGLDLGTTLDVIEQSSGQSWIGSDRLRRAIAGDFAPRAHTTLLAKDTRLALAAAQAAGFEPALGRIAADTFARAIDAGLAGEDDASVFKLLGRTA
ncbi:NAD(P)-dependent oxidoreductase [Rhodoferax sediminis]|uniref:NAD(P)-dependent oxidoreductase n=1 Tax=Rhodoferax sediminis TaxID=2509614 RepID=A0A515DF35_9BURK|nr:NAD(P)-dependent oxidoreductase [Rhodoferax sediminis]QDL39028.1 NAD(P)-dependent oxidoreductase [Rhodoferax sediminis]